jgi:hypothetical protein
LNHNCVICGKPIETPFGRRERGRPPTICSPECRRELLNARARKYRAANPQKMNERVRTFRAANRQLIAARRRADYRSKLKGLADQAARHDADHGEAAEGGDGTK